MKEKDRPQSEFNYAISHLNRINATFILANEAAINLDINEWFHSLLLLKRELTNYYKDKTEKEQINKIITKIREHLTSHQHKKNRNKTVQPELYDQLDQLETKLRQIMGQSGLEGKKEEDAKKALK